MLGVPAPHSLPTTAVLRLILVLMSQVAPSKPKCWCAAGVAGTKNWNNLQLNNGFPGDDEIILDVGGVPQASSVTVEWTSNNTWSNDGRGEDTNNAPDGNDRC